MKITVQSIRFDADKKLLAFIQKKVSKLDQFCDKIVSAEVYLRLENVVEETNKITEVKVMLPGNQLFCKEKCKSFEEGIDLAMECLRKQIDKHKQRKAAMIESSRKAVLVTAEEEY